MRSGARRPGRAGDGRSTLVLRDPEGRVVPVDLRPDPRRPERPAVLLLLSADCLACRALAEDLTAEASRLREVADVVVVVPSPEVPAGLRLPVPVVVATPDPRSAPGLALRPALVVAVGDGPGAAWSGPVGTVEEALARIAEAAARRGDPATTLDAGAPLRPADGVGVAPLDDGLLVVAAGTARWLGPEEASVWAAAGVAVAGADPAALRARQLRLGLWRDGLLVPAAAPVVAPTPLPGPRPIPEPRDCCGRRDVARLSSLPGTVVAAGPWLLGVHAPDGPVGDLLRDLLAPIAAPGPAPMGLALAPVGPDDGEWLLWRAGTPVARARPGGLLGLVVRELEVLAPPPPGTVRLDGALVAVPGGVEARVDAADLPSGGGAAVDVARTVVVPGRFAEVAEAAARLGEGAPAAAALVRGRLLAWRDGADHDRPGDAAVALARRSVAAPDVAPDAHARLLATLAPLHL